MSFVRLPTGRGLVSARVLDILTGSDEPPSDAPSDLASDVSLDGSSDDVVVERRFAETLLRTWRMAAA